MVWNSQWPGLRGSSIASGSEDCKGPSLTCEILQVPEARRVMPCLSRLEPTLPEPFIGCLPNSPHLIGIDPAMCEVLCEQVW